MHSDNKRGPRKSSSYPQVSLHVLLPFCMQRGLSKWMQAIYRYMILTHISKMVAFMLFTTNVIIFSGLDGCFIKLSTGQQILAATGRDGNNNIFPIAFGVVDKEDTDNWTWFLTQLRTVIGSGNKFGKYTIMSDRQKVCAPLLMTTTL